MIEQYQVGAAPTYWVVFCFNDDQRKGFFDFYGVPSHRYTKYFEDFLNRNAVQWTYKGKHPQRLSTVVCGHVPYVLQGGHCPGNQD